MKVQIRSVQDKGDIRHERLVLHVKRDVDIGDFMLLRTVFARGHPTTNVTNTLWFPDMLMRAGDIVVVYSKSGSAKQKEISGGRTAHFFYWQQDSTLWDDETVAPVLLYAREWASKAPHELVDSST